MVLKQSLKSVNSHSWFSDDGAGIQPEVSARSKILTLIVFLPSSQGCEGLLYSSKLKSCQLEGNWHLSSN